MKPLEERAWGHEPFGSAGASLIDLRPTRPQATAGDDPARPRFDRRRSSWVAGMPRVSLVIPTLKKLGAADVHTCVLLRKDRDTAREVEVDFVGFDIPDEFVIGYGLDYDNLYRNLPSICTLKKEVYAPEAAATP